MKTNPKPDKEPKPTMSQSFFKACLLILLGVVAISIALELLAHLWGWLLLLGIIVIAVWVGIRLHQAKRNKW